MYIYIMGYKKTNINQYDSLIISEIKMIKRKKFFMVL